MALRTIKIKEEPKERKTKKRRFYGKGEWWCTACCAIYTSLEARSLNIDPKCGCPNCGGVLEYEEV
jgi:hypothetical protein